MNILHRITLAATLAVASVTVSSASELAGKWTSEFDSQIGPQKYVYNFKDEGGKITGKASYDHQMGKGDSELSQIKVDKDDVSFLEMVHTNDMDLQITYKGKLMGDEMKLHRIVGDYGSEDIVVKRAKADAKPDESKPSATK